MSAAEVVTAALAKPATVPQIAEATGIPGRTVRRVISTMRRAGAAVSYYGTDKITGTRATYYVQSCNAHLLAALASRPPDPDKIDPVKAVMRKIAAGRAMLGMGVWFFEMGR